MVVRGFQDCTEYDCIETYAPVIQLVDFCFLMSAAIKLNLTVHQMDIKTAFLNDDLHNEELFMEISEEVLYFEELRKTKICPLKKALYGLCIIPKRWYAKFRYPFQQCIFVWRNNGLYVIVALYVDDLLIIRNNVQKILSLKICLSTIFEMLDLGEPRIFLGIEIEKVPDGMLLYQKKFIKKLLSKFGMSECNPVQTPCVTTDATRKGVKHRLLNVTENDFRKIPFCQAIGSLLYLMRQDLT